MIDFEEALDIVLNSAFTLPEERIPFGSSLGRILAENITADMEMPPFDKTAVDGYACRSEDLEKELEVIEIVPAGKKPEKSIHAGQCSKIMTGAQIPAGADWVVMVEDVTEKENNHIQVQKKGGKSNICYLGEDVRQNDIVLPKNTMIKAQHIAVMATFGTTGPWVKVQPRVGVISTGDELVEPDQKPRESQIRNSNAYQLIAQVSQSHAIPSYYGIAEDNEESTFRTLQKAVEENDVVLLTGGVSMGDFDFVPKIIQQLNFQILFQKVAVQPGKPTTFARKEKKSIFGLPGNPVSSFIQFEMLVKPFLYKLMDYEFIPSTAPFPLGEDYTRKRVERLAFIPVKFVGKEVVPVEYHGSAHISALPFADGIMSIPKGVKKIEKGEYVSVRFI